MLLRSNEVGSCWKLEVQQGEQGAAGSEGRRVAMELVIELVMGKSCRHCCFPKVFRSGGGAFRGRATIIRSISTR